jgi:hypothetical protein
MREESVEVNLIALGWTVQRGKMKMEKAGNSYKTF